MTGIANSLKKRTLLQKYQSAGTSFLIEDESLEEAESSIDLLKSAGCDFTVISYPKGVVLWKTEPKIGSKSQERFNSFMERLNIAIFGKDKDKIVVPFEGIDGDILLLSSYETNLLLKRVSTEMGGGLNFTVSAENGAPKIFIQGV